MTRPHRYAKRCGREKNPRLYGVGCLGIPRRMVNFPMLITIALVIIALLPLAFRFLVVRVLCVVALCGCAMVELTLGPGAAAREGIDVLHEVEKSGTTISNSFENVFYTGISRATSTVEERNDRFLMPVILGLAVLAVVPHRRRSRGMDGENPGKQTAS